MFPVVFVELEHVPNVNESDHVVDVLAIDRDPGILLMDDKLPKIF